MLPCCLSHSVLHFIQNKSNVHLTTPFVILSWAPASWPGRLPWKNCLCSRFARSCTRPNPIFGLGSLKYLAFLCVIRIYSPTMLLQALSPSLLGDNKVSLCVWQDAAQTDYRLCTFQKMIPNSWGNCVYTLHSVYSQQRPPRISLTRFPLIGELSPPPCLIRDRDDRRCHGGEVAWIQTIPAVQEKSRRWLRSLIGKISILSRTDWYPADGKASLQ